MQEAAALSDRSNEAVSVMRDTLRTQQRLAAVTETLAQAESVSQQLRDAERSFERGEAANSASHVSELSRALDALGPRGADLFPTAQLRLDKLRISLLDQMQPVLLRAVAERDTEAMSAHVRVYSALGKPDKPRACYVECQQGPIFEHWNAASRKGEPVEALVMFWDFLLEYCRREQPWISSVFPGEDALLPALIAEALESLRPQVEEALVSVLHPLPAGGAYDNGPAAPDSDNGAAAALSAGLASLEALGERALGCAAMLGQQLRGGGSAAALHQLLVPLDAARLQYPAALARLLRPQLPHLPALPEPAVHTAPGPALRLSTDALQVIDAATEPLFQLIRPAVHRCLAFGGPLAAQPTVELVADLFGAHADALTALMPTRTESRAAEGDAPSSSHLALLAASAPDSVESPREALLLLRTLHSIRSELVSLELSFSSDLRRECTAALDSGALRSASQAAAASQLVEQFLSDGTGDDPSLMESVMERMEQLMLEGQKLAFTHLVAGVARSLREVAAPALASTWSKQCGSADEDASLLAFSASPLPYITQVGEHLLGLPQQLEPFTTGRTLTQLSQKLKPQTGDVPLPPLDAEDAQTAEADAPMEWLRSISHATTELLLREASLLEELSLLGAKQLAADAGYLSNILSGGLGLPPNAVLAELEVLLTAPPERLDCCVQQSCSIPRSLALALAAKRGTRVQ